MLLPKGEEYSLPKKMRIWYDIVNYYSSLYYKRECDKL